MKASAGYPILFMALLSAVFAAAVSSVAVATRARVEAGERARERSHVLSAAGIEAPQDAEALEAVWNRSVEERSDEGGIFYAVGDPAQGLVGYVFPFEGPGFWGPINGVVAVDTRGEKIIGISFIRHQETPGLGGRIAEDWFRAQFRGKPLDSPPEGGPPLKFVFGPPQGPREVEAITGATQTSTRLGRFLNPFLAGLKKRSVFKAGGGG